MSDVQLSVVIAASNERRLLERCLASLEDQVEQTKTEVIVVSNYEGASGLIAERFPWVEHADLPENTTVPALRAHGIAASSGAVVALTEDHCVFDAHWAAALMRVHEGSCAVIGGSVDHRGADRPIDWAVYLHEYGRYMPPNEPGPAERLPGNNVSYKREALDSVKNQFAGGFFEEFIHQELRRRGFDLYLEPSVRVYHVKSYDAGRVLKQCFYHGRSFAGMRTAEGPPVHRAMLTAGALVLPFLLPARIVVQAIRKKRNMGALLRALPYVVLFMTSWSLGELCGYAAGEGDSTQQWT